MFKRLQSLRYLVVAIVLATSATAATAREITVMTRNLYLGADLGPVISATTQEEFLSAAQTALAQVAANNFPERAQALAAEIVEKKPHLVGLQEVYSFTFNGFNGPPPFRDHLADLMAALSAQGADYRVAAVVQNLDVHVPLGGNVVGVTDRDVILARGDVATTVVPVALSGCRSSVDGCNYHYVANATTPVGDISIERGFVAVDAAVDGMPVRFVDTHLEERELVPSNLLIGKFFQAAQASELISILAGLPNLPSAKIIITGDMNSSPKDPTLTLPVFPFMIIPPYKQLVDAGYVDAWTLRPGNPPGFTCCQAENLLNLESTLTERLDMTFSREMPFGRVKVNLVGNEETNKTPSGLWPSDHAGVVTRLDFASKRREVYDGAADSPSGSRADCHGRESHQIPYDESR